MLTETEKVLTSWNGIFKTENWMHFLIYARSFILLERALNPTLQAPLAKWKLLTAQTIDHDSARFVLQVRARAVDNIFEDSFFNAQRYMTQTSCKKYYHN